MKAKTTYFKNMSQLEIYFHQKEKDEKTEKMDNLIKNIHDNGINPNIYVVNLRIKSKFKFIILFPNK